MLGAKSIVFVETGKILPNEQVYSERVNWLVDKIQSEGLWRVPVTLDKSSYAVMDGHHRLEAARRLKLPCVPCLLLDYSEVSFVSTHESLAITPKMVGEYAKAGTLFPPKSTRHIFSNPLPTCNISLTIIKNTNDNGLHLS
ncbi:ParB N-terminal domain-containing protein [Thalassomonas actiniarum]|uniref:ParB N-terminal domain-containing protein n=1 Tax=Thalassomonas actiniarum TaxID=485447 RepID=A0AAF0C3P8_9GAMM|nr:ParB N-terminal domain-containing protein [Thalassomonas actiniarum]WDD99772.1 ParB N-terminal domain-containing protein [Thalassomonas actiniarum]